MNSKITVLAFALLTSVAAFATSPSSLTITAASTSSVYNVCYKASEMGKVKVSIFNSNNQLVFSEVMNNVASFMRPYNFSQLSEGVYTVVVENKNGKQAEKVNYTMNKVTSMIKVTEVANTTDKYLLQVATTGTQTVSVRIYNAGQKLVHEQEVEVNGNFGLIYNLSKVKTAGAVTFEVSTSNGKFETIRF